MAGKCPYFFFCKYHKKLLWFIEIYAVKLSALLKIKGFLLLLIKLIDFPVLCNFFISSFAHNDEQINKLIKYIIYIKKIIATCKKNIVPN